MMLLNSAESAARRTDQIRECPELQLLASRLRRFVEPVLADAVFIPEQKAMLTRDGGACPNDTARLKFDPLSPHEHKCPKCGDVFRGERHYEAWIWRYHIWLSERVIHLALLGTLEDDNVLRSRAFQILDRYSKLYRGYPNHDNVLGPTRLFFSTYLESIWLLQLIVAATLLDTNVTGGAGTDTYDWRGFSRMVAESAGLVASFDEGWSNRQVWNNAALLAAGLWLERDRSEGQSLIAHALDGQHGIRPQLVAAVSGDGLWFEGENYHFFALRGFLLAAELARLAGLDLYQTDGPAGRLQEMFVAPLYTVLPDLTLPARGDSPYGVSLLQPRFAELWEIGWARTGDERLASILHQLYSMDAPEREDTGFSELAEQEQNQPAQLIQRHMLGWKALCWMALEYPIAPAELWRSGSKILLGAGVALLRTSPDRYLSVEFGGRPGGHGHPDVLHLTIWWDRPVLMDFGAASYVTPSLHWYRSTLAHNAPGISGQGQLARNAWCHALDHVGGWAWCRVEAEDLLGDASSVTRTVVVGPDSIIDRLDIAAADDVSVDLPIHPLEANPPPSELSGERQADVSALGAATPVPIGGELRLSLGKTDLVLSGRAGESVYWVERLGPPDDQFADGVPLHFLVRRASGPGTWVQCYMLNAAKPARVLHVNGDVIVEHGDGSQDRITVTKRGCRIIDRAGNKLRLDGVRERPVQSRLRKIKHRRIRCPVVESIPSLSEWRELVPQDCVINLGKSHYRMSEERYGAHGEFRAQAAVFAVGSNLCFVCDVRKTRLCFRAPDAPDPGLDNETPDVHSDGVQCYIELHEWLGFLVVPLPDSDAVRVNPVTGTPADSSRVSGSWQATKGGYRILVAIDVGRTLRPGDAFPMNLVVNEMYSDRVRRTGQLALSGGGGWVYLRGDREARGSAVIAEVS